MSQNLLVAVQTQSSAGQQALDGCKKKIVFTSRA